MIRYTVHVAGKGRGPRTHQAGRAELAGAPGAEQLVFFDDAGKEVARYKSGEWLGCSPSALPAKSTGAA